MAALECVGGGPADGDRVQESGSGRLLFVHGGLPQSWFTGAPPEPWGPEVTPWYHLYSVEPWPPRADQAPVYRYRGVVAL
jgi:hypothetical protein